MTSSEPVLSEPVLIISDIHANLEALKAVLKHSRNRYTDIWVLGDIAGYGPNPAECLSILRQKNAKIITGNHDAAICGRIQAKDFNDTARGVVELHKRELSTADKKFLAQLPLQLKERSVTMVHGSPRDPIWEYIDSLSIADRILAQVQTSLTLVGHTHQSRIWIRERSDITREVNIQIGQKISYQNSLVLANPGSTGQSRNHNPDARYAILHPERKWLTFHSCPWNRRITRRKMLAKDYPQQLIDFMAPV